MSRPTLTIALAGVGVLAALTSDGTADVSVPGAGAGAETSISRYFDELEKAGLIDIETGSKETLAAELGAAEALLRAGATVEAAVALYAIVESPRYEAFADFTEYQNAEYDLAVALAASGAYDSALHYLERSMRRGPSAMYFAPAHRRAVDIALETRTYREVLDRLTAIRHDEPISPAAAGERAYLRARMAYDAGDLAAAEGELTKIGKRSRLYSSSVYLRGVIQARRGQFRSAADAMCEIVDTPDDDTFTFVVDDRYFTIKDLARLGLGRIAHEVGEYDDAYYHYFQIPDDSDRLPEALFEAAWSMYQKRELDTARDLVAEFLDKFPSTPLSPEARLLAGYIELADCEFDDAQRHYDELVAALDPVVAEMDRIRKSPAARARLFERALVRWRSERADPGQRLADRATTPTDKVVGLLRLDPAFVRLHEAVTGMDRAAGDAPFAAQQWLGLAAQRTRVGVKAVAAEASGEQEDAADAAALLEDVRRLREDLVRARAELRRGVRERTLPADVAEAERQRLAKLGVELDALEARAARAARETAEAVTRDRGGSIAGLLAADIEQARKLQDASRRLQERLGRAADELARRAIERLYHDTRRVLDKAKLGKIDAVIGQKRKLEIEVQDLATGRYPPELHGRLWEEGLIGDDEEYWPFEGEYWSDEYERYR